MKKVADTKKEDEFIEKVGLFFEKGNRIPRIGGKIFGYLLICIPEKQTANQIIKRLKIAKSSFSSMINLLIEKQVVEEITILGERSKYYKIKQGGWEDLFLSGLKRVTSLRNLFKDGKKLLKGKKKSAINRINELDNLYKFFEYEIPKIIKRWKKYNKNK